MKFKMVRIANPKIISDTTGYDNNKYPSMVRYVGVDDDKWFVVNCEDDNNFYPADEFLMMINISKFTFIELS